MFPLLLVNMVVWVCFRINSNINTKLIFLPACTLSPFRSSDIVTDLPFSRVTLAVDGKHSDFGGGGGGGGGVGGGGTRKQTLGVVY